MQDDCGIPCCVCQGSPDGHKNPSPKQYKTRLDPFHVIVPNVRVFFYHRITEDESFSLLFLLVLSPTSLCVMALVSAWSDFHYLHAFTLQTHTFTQYVLQPIETSAVHHICPATALPHHRQSISRLNMISSSIHQPPRLVSGLYYKSIHNIQVKTFNLTNSTWSLSLSQLSWVFHVLQLRCVCCL